MQFVIFFIKIFFVKKNSITFIKEYDDMILLMAWMGFLSIVAFTVLIGTLVATMEPLPVAEASEPFLGQVQMVGFNFCPRGWSTTDGQLLPISQNQALFSLLGTTYGGDGETTFGLPELRGRDAVHVGQGPGLPNVSWGQRAGTHSYSQENGDFLGTLRTIWWDPRQLDCPELSERSVAQSLQ